MVCGRDVFLVGVCRIVGGGGIKYLCGIVRLVFRGLFIWVLIDLFGVGILGWGVVRDKDKRD